MGGKRGGRTKTPTGAVRVERVGTGPASSVIDRYTWRPPADVAGELPAGFTLVLDAHTARDGVRRFVPIGGPIALVLPAALGGAAVTAVRSNPPPEERFADHASRLVYQLAPRLREHLARSFTRPADLYVTQAGRVGGDDRHVLPDDLGRDARGRGRPWSPADLMEAGRAAAAAAGADPTPATCIRLAVLPGDSRQTHAVCFSADGRTLYSGGFTGVVKVWDVTGRKAVATRNVSSMVWSLTLTPDGRRLLTGDDAGRVEAWDAGTLAPAGGFDAHTDRVWFIRFSQDGKRILTGSLDQTARVWEADGWKPVRTLRGHTNDVMGGGWATGGRVVTCGDKTVRTWDPGRDQEARVLTAPGSVAGIAFSPDGRLVAAAGQWGLAAWDAVTGTPAGRWGRRGESARAVAFTPDGSAVIGGGLDGQVRVWPLAGGPSRAWAAHPSPVLEVAVRGDRIVTSDVSGGVAVWDLATGAKVWARADAHRGSVFGLALSPDGTRVASGGGDRVVRLWDAATGDPAGELTGHAGGVARLAYAPDGTRLASASLDNTLRVWEPSSGRAAVVKAHVHYLSGVAFAPDGTRVIDACGDKTLKLYDPATGREVFTLRGHAEWVEAVAFSPDGRVASGARDGKVRLWDAPPSAAVEIPPEADEPVEPD